MRQEQINRVGRSAVLWRLPMAETCKRNAIDSFRSLVRELAQEKNESEFGISRFEAFYLSKGSLAHVLRFESLPETPIHLEENCMQVTLRNPLVSLNNAVGTGYFLETTYFTEDTGRGDVVRKRHRLLYGMRKSLQELLYIRDKYQMPPNNFDDFSNPRYLIRPAIHIPKSPKVTGALRKGLVMRKEGFVKLLFFSADGKHKDFITEGATHMEELNRRLSEIDKEKDRILSDFTEEEKVFARHQ